MKVDGEVIERGGWFFYFEIKIVAAVLIKSSVYACFSVVGMVKLHSPPLFWFFFGLFLFQSLGFRGFQRD